MDNKDGTKKESVVTLREILEGLDNNQIETSNVSAISEAFLHLHGINRNNFTDRMFEKDVEIGVAIAIMYFAGMKGMPKYITDAPCISLILHIFKEIMKKDHDENCPHCKIH